MADLHAQSSSSDDSVPLDASFEDAGGRGKGSPRFNAGNLKLLLALFIMFVIVVSDPFTNSVLAGFGGKAVRCRSPTSWGIVLQGLFLVIGYILMLYLIDRGVF